MKRIYLPGLNFAAFHAMTTNLRAGGHTVTNNAEVNPDGGTWNDCMRRDIVALMDCDTMATLPGWEHSKGARLEVLIAEHLGMTVVKTSRSSSKRCVGCRTTSARVHIFFATAPPTCGFPSASWAKARCVVTRKSRPVRSFCEMAEADLAATP